MFTVCIIGAGFSGICAAVRLKIELGNICHVTIFDENYDFGGVWLKNTYPGCACEVPSHLYCFSWEPNPEWSKAYCSQNEILTYLQNISMKYGLCAKFNHFVHKIKWDEKSLNWKVTVEDKKSVVLNKTEELNFDIIIHAQGRFASPQIPKEYENFEGPVLHTAQWDKEVKVEGKNVLVVGCGASGAQVIPKLGLTSNFLIVYQRHAPWVMPRTNFPFPECIKRMFANVPLIHRAYRNLLHWVFERNISGFRIGSIANRLAPLLSKFHLWRQVKDPKIRKQLTPNYNFGCKRIVNSNEYYRTFNLANVILIDNKILVEKNGILTESGHRYDVDVIVLATGFQVQNLFGQISVIGKNGIDIPQLWMNDKPKSYLSIMSSAGPNLFILLGPNASTGYTSIIIQLETQVEWVLKVIRELNSKNKKAICVKDAAEQKYMHNLESKLKKTVYGSSQCDKCNSWYLNSKGDVVEIYPDSTLAYKKETLTIVSSDFEFC